jgi:hypothetical protein
MWLISAKNLISLCFRPLRLCFSSESIRSARIVELKVTHFPFVAIIWAYESSQQYVRNARRASPLVSNGSLPSNSQPLAPGGRKKHPALNLLAASPGKDRPSHHTDAYNTRVPASGSTDSVAELVALVQRLSSQVDELTSIVTSQKD